MIQEHLSTKEEILRLLKTYNEQTVAKLATKLEITEMAVRRHLQNLENDGYVTSSLIRKSLGRPLSVYSLTEKGEDTFPKHYKDILLELVTYLDKEGMKEEVIKFFEKKFESMYDISKIDIENKNFDEIVQLIASIQDETGHMVDSEIINANTAEIKQMHCPISQLSCQYPEICQCEKNMIQKFFPNQEVELNCSLAEGDKVCSFLIKPKH